MFVVKTRCSYLSDNPKGGTLYIAKICTNFVKPYKSSRLTTKDQFVL